MDTDLSETAKYRLKPGGSAGRAMVLAATTLIVGVPAGAVVILTIADEGFVALGPGLAGVLVGLALLWLWVRLPFVGVALTSERVVVTSWWRTREFNKRDLVRWSSDPYMGSLFVVAWPVASGAAELGSLHVETRTGELISLGGTVAWRGTTTKQARYLNEWLTGELGGGRQQRRQAASEARTLREAGLLRGRPRRARWEGFRPW